MVSLAGDSFDMRWFAAAAIAMMCGAAAPYFYTSWRWSHADMAALFTNRITAEIPPNVRMSVVPGSILTGDVSASGRLVCGTVRITDALGITSTDMYSLNLVRTPFSISVADGYSPLIGSGNKARSDYYCSQLSAHAKHGGAATSE